VNGPLVWRAVLIGGAVNVAISLLMSFGSTPLFGFFGPEYYAMLAFSLRMMSALSDIAGGAVAGYLARRDGLVHGALGSVLATVVMLPVTFIRVAAMGGQWTPDAAYWIDFGLWFGVGLFLAAVAGFLAMQVRIARGR
jgi:hypothetical protein